MTLQEAVKALEKDRKVTRRAILDEDKTLPKVCSGGVVKFDEIQPALYSSAERAIDAWFQIAENYVGKADSLEWVDMPSLVEFQTTIASRNIHRMVSHRFAVKSQFVVTNV